MDYQGSILRSKGTVRAKKISASAGLRQPLEATRGRDPEGLHQVAIGGPRGPYSQNFIALPAIVPEIISLKSIIIY